METPNQGYGAFALLGILSNYGKFEFTNPYRLRLDDFDNEEAMLHLVHCVGESLAVSREVYVALQDDQQESWMSLSSTLSVLSLGIISSKPQTTAAGLSEDDLKRAFAELPPPELLILLPTYEFIAANKVFANHLVTEKSREKQGATPFASFVSTCSYLLQHAYRSPRAATYASLSLLILQTMLEDPTTAESICSASNKCSPRLCRQRLPLTPAVAGDRTPVTAILDVLVAGLSHNLQIRLDVEFYE